MRENLSLDKLWEGEEICGCGHPWPEMLYSRPHPSLYIFFNLKIFFTFLLLLKGTNSEGFAFRGRRGGDTVFS